MDGGASYNPRTVEEVFRDFKGRRAGMIKALTTGTLFLRFFFRYITFWRIIKCGFVFRFLLQMLKSFTSSVILVSFCFLNKKIYGGLFGLFSRVLTFWFLGNLRGKRRGRVLDTENFGPFLFTVGYVVILTP
jgi:hypothetical protein